MTRMQKFKASLLDRLLGPRLEIKTTTENGYLGPRKYAYVWIKYRTGPEAIWKGPSPGQRSVVLPPWLEKRCQGLLNAWFVSADGQEAQRYNALAWLGERLDALSIDLREKLKATTLSLDRVDRDLNKHDRRLEDLEARRSRR